jgi:hypothetical protein
VLASKIIARLFRPDRKASVRTEPLFGSTGARKLFLAVLARSAVARFGSHRNALVRTEALAQSSRLELGFAVLARLGHVRRLASTIICGKHCK